MAGDGLYDDGTPLLNHHHVCIVTPEMPLPVYWMMSEALVDAFTALGATTTTELTDHRPVQPQPWPIEI